MRRRGSDAGAGDDIKEPARWRNPGGIKQCLQRQTG
jgi:hypothetical protein